MRRYLLLASILVLLPTVSSARTWYILPGGSGDAPTIQEGINRADVGDTVLVGPGTYYENIEFMGRDIVLKSEMGPEVTTIDGSREEDSVVKIWKGETGAAVLEGFTMAGGRGWPLGPTEHYGGAILCLDSSPMILGNIITGNTIESRGSGAGMQVLSGPANLSNPQVLNNVFRGNHSSHNGGALGIGDSHAEVRYNEFAGNEAADDGGAVYVSQNRGSLDLYGNLFVENRAGDHGGAMHVSQTSDAQPALIRYNEIRFNSTSGIGGFGDTGSGGGIDALGIFYGEISHNTIVSNDGTNAQSFGGGGISLFETSAGLLIANNIIARNIEGGVACWYGTATLGPNLFWQNEGGDLGSGVHSCPEAWRSTQIFADPLFCNPGLDDYHVVQSSPALAGPEVFGAYDTPGCAEVPVRSTTWGRLKAMYQ